MHLLPSMRSCTSVDIFLLKLLLELLSTDHLFLLRNSSPISTVEAADYGQSTRQNATEEWRLSAYTITK